jgi:hypothetical protein
MLYTARPSSILVDEGRILHFVSGSMRFVLNNRILQKIINSFTEEPTLEINHLQGKSVSGFLFHARSTPGFGEKGVI